MSWNRSWHDISDSWVCEHEPGAQHYYYDMGVFIKHLNEAHGTKIYFEDRSKQRVEAMKREAIF